MSPMTQPSRSGPHERGASVPRAGQPNAAIGPRAVRRGTSKGRSRGQSLTELALILPVFLLVILIGLDFGRVFLAWVEINNAARIGANFAAQNPDAWDAGNPNAAEQAQYQQLMTNEWAGIDCTAPSPVPDPAFPNGNGIGAPAQVTITCHFHPITPIISNVVGGATGIVVTALAAFPIRAGAIDGIPIQSTAPTPSPSPSPTPTSGPTPSPTPSPSPTPTPMCNVPNFKNSDTSTAQATWNAAGFTTTVVFSPLIPPNYTIKSQNLAKGQSLPCGTTVIKVSNP